MNRIELLKKMIANQPAEPFNLYALALEYNKNGRQREALDLFDELLQKHPEYIATYYHYGQALEASEDYNKALKVYRAGIKKAAALEDHHSLSELKNVLLNLEIELDL